jgi:hypothetical protein
MRRRLPLSLSIGLAIAVLGSSIATSGLGEPFELDAADRAMRFAAESLGAHGFAEAARAPDPPPEVAGGPLPRAAVALGFALFGPHVWAGRAFIAVAALVAVSALAVLLARLVDRRAAAYGAAALATTPLFFVQARTMLGDAVAMAAWTLAFAGLGVALLDRRAHARHGDRAAPPWFRILAFAIGALGLVAGGLSRGALLGVAAPALGVGAAWAATRGRGRDRFADACGALALLTGASAAAISVPEIGKATSHAPFDAVLHRLGHGAFPWSALLPLVLLALLAPSPRRGIVAAARDDAARALVVACAVTAAAAHALSADGRVAAPFLAPAVLAAAVAIALRDLDRAGAPSAAPREGLRDGVAARAAGVASALFVALLAHDLLSEPARALAPIVPLRAGAAIAAPGRVLLVASSALAVVLALVAFDVGGRRATTTTRDRYLAWPRALLATFGGRLATALTAVEATLVSAALALALRPERAAKLGELVRVALRHAWWAFPLVVLGVAWVPLLARDAVRALRRRAGLPRGGAVLVTGALAGAGLAWGHFPALLGTLSPRDALTRWAALHAKGEPLGSLGVSARAATLEAGAAVQPLADAAAASSFLAQAASGTRSWVVLRREDLPALNALVRARGSGNAAVMTDDGAGAALVASARLPSDPPAPRGLDDLVLDAPPPIAHPLDAAVGDALVALGWDLRGPAGADQGASIAPLVAHTLRLYYRVVGRVDDGLCSFVHVDGQGRRWNAEHRDFARYPLRYWRTGDVIVDDFEIKLAGNFTPGAYALRFGFDRLPCDGHARLPVKRGPHDGDQRVAGGFLDVR